MKDYIKKYGVRVGAAIIVVVLIVLLVTGLRHGRAGLAANTAGALASPVGQAADSAIDWIEGLYGYIYRYDQLVAENNALRAQLAEARQAAISATEYEEENARLRELMGFAEKHEDFVLDSVTTGLPGMAVSPASTNF